MPTRARVLSFRLPHRVRYTYQMPPSSPFVVRGAVVHIHSSLRDDRDVHNRAYREVMNWYYGLVVRGVLGLAAALVLQVSLIYLVAMILAFVLAHPLCFALSSRYRLWCEISASL